MLKISLLRSITDEDYETCCRHENITDIEVLLCRPVSNACPDAKSVVLGVSVVVAAVLVAEGKHGEGYIRWEVDTRIDVRQLDRPVSLAIGIDRTGIQQPLLSPSQIPPTSSLDIRLKEEVKDPNGRVVSQQ